MTSTPTPNARPALTATDVRLAAHWLRRQAEAAGLKAAEYLTDRRHRPRQTWTRAEGQAR